MFTLLKVDKIMASTLPIGKYPLLSMPKVTVIIVLSWILSVSVSILVNTIYPCSYEPAVVLCIPILPIGFFITVFSCFCVIFIVIIVGFIISILYLKKVGLHELIFKLLNTKLINFFKNECQTMSHRCKRRCTTTRALYPMLTTRLLKRT